MHNLKLLTLNLHCLEEENVLEKQKTITNKIIELDIDIIFLQEVAQTATKSIIIDNIKEDNYGFELQKQLQDNNKSYYYYFEPIKHSFGKYDEGLAILSKYPLHNKKGTHISKSTDYYNWKSRKVLTLDYGISITLFNTHLGWTDEYETFEEQVDMMLSGFNNETLNILAGDFNVSPDSKGYEYVVGKGLYDLYYNNDPKYRDTPTHINDMDVHSGSTRIDYLFSNKQLEIIERSILFEDERVSDHYGVYLNIKTE